MRRSEERHFCRHCEVSWDPTPGTTPSAHMSALMHYVLHHPIEANLPTRCDKNCLSHEQPDEKQHGVRLYGPGAARLSEVVPLIMTSEQVFGEED